VLKSSRNWFKFPVPVRKKAGFFTLEGRHFTMGLIAVQQLLVKHAQGTVLGLTNESVFASKLFPFCSDAVFVEHNHQKIWSMKPCFLWRVSFWCVTDSTGQTHRTERWVHRLTIGTLTAMIFIGSPQGCTIGTNEMTMQGAVFCWIATGTTSGFCDMWMTNAINSRLINQIN